MVGRRLIMAMMMLLTATVAEAQYYAADDTTYIYPNKGTFYHDRFQGRKTTSGEVFDQNGFTAAHWKLKFGTLVLVSNKNTGKEVIVKINDRCPKRGVLDMTHRAATALGIRGCQPVELRVLPTTERYVEQWRRQFEEYDSVEVKQVAQKSVATAVKTTTKAASATKKTSDSEKTAYIVLGTVGTHSQAYNLSQHIMSEYRDYVLIDEHTGDNSLLLIIDTCLPTADAEKACATLRRAFPYAHTTRCE